MFLFIVFKVQKGQLQYFIFHFNILIYVYQTTFFNPLKGILYCRILLQYISVILMSFNNFKTRISFQYFLPSSPVSFGRGWTLSTPAAVLSGVVHTPLFSQQEKTHGGESEGGVVYTTRQEKKNAEILPSFLCLFSPQILYFTVSSKIVPLLRITEKAQGCQCE